MPIADPSITLYQVDAFASRVFTGNPAAVIPLKSWLPDKLLQSIAEENRLSETAYFVRELDGSYRIRWFTPEREVALCGHATLAAAHVLFEHLDFSGSSIPFQSMSGPLNVFRHGNQRYRMNFPVDHIEPINPPEGLVRVPGCEIEACYRGQEDLMIVVADETAVRNLKPDLRALALLETRGLIVTAPANALDRDFVSRCFFPRFGIDEDPVTGSAHCTMMPYWSERLNRRELIGHQISKRSGIVECAIVETGERVDLVGEARTYLVGEIQPSKGSGSRPSL